jgi:hypothetical protein
MEKTVQLSESEYKELSEKAGYNQNQIEELAVKMYQEKGAKTIQIEMDIKQDKYADLFDFNVSVWVKDNDGYKVEKLQLSYEDRQRIIKFVKGKIEELFQRNFSRSIANINNWNDRLKKLRNWKWKFIDFTVFGWLAALALVLIAIFK